MRYINQQDALKALGDCIKPGTKRTKDAIELNPLHHNNLYATTKAERSNNQENDLMRPHKNKRRGNEPLITLTRDL